jgi:hypothetical protein
VKLADDYLALKPATVITAVERIVAAGRPTSILAFGSRARGDALIDSDLRQRLADLPLSKDILVTDPEHFAEHSSPINSVYHEAAEEGLYLWRNGEWNAPVVEGVCRYRPEPLSAAGVP